MTGLIDHRCVAPGPTHAQVFGERRTGTNFLEALAAAQLKLEMTRRFGWKHGAPSMPCLPEDALILVIMREPVSWLSSLHNRPFAHSHRGLDFSEFLRKDWEYRYNPGDFGHARYGYQGMPKARRVPAQLDRHPVTGKRFAGPLELRRVKAAAMLGFLERDCNVAVIDYDTLRRDPEGIMADLSARFDIQRREAAEMPPQVGPAGHDGTRVTLDAMAPEDASFILNGLDHAQERRLGYQNALKRLAKQAA